MSEEAIDFLSACWRNSGLRPGDMVLVHSSITKTFRRVHAKFKVKITANDIVESFLRAAGAGGTVLFPLFNFDFTKGIRFDIRSTPSAMGVISEAARLRTGAVRTGHPVYSFCVFGKHQPLFERVDNFSGYGPDSPFAILRENDGKIAILDLPDQHSMTFYHHVEELLDVDYRYHKRFTAEYTEPDGRVSERTYGLFVRDIEKGVLTDVNRMGDLLWMEGLYAGDRYGKDGCGLRSIKASALFDRVARVINEGQALDYLYSIGQKK